ncbi:MAG: metallophosphoesterase [Pseudomonadota bacterium]
MSKKTKKIFAIGDIHGCAWELKELFKKLPLEDNSTIVFLGDYIDRGRESKQVIDFIIALARTYDVVTLTGNHEAMFLDFIHSRSSPGAALFIYNGGGATLASYGIKDPNGDLGLPQQHMDFFNNLKMSHEEDDYFFVHAGLPDVPINEIGTEKHYKTMLWIRDKFHRSRFDWGKKIIHGHSPVSEVDFRSNRINTDTGCAYDNKLSAVELPSMKTYSVERRVKFEPVKFRAPDSRRESERFEGSIDVFINRDGHLIEFETGDYSEQGMNLHARRDRKKLLLGIDEEVEGYLTSKHHDVLHFKGHVARIWQEETAICYGLKLHSSATTNVTPKVKEEVDFLVS